MQCSKHPNFKGIRKPKRDCPECLEIWSLYNDLQIREGKKYRSITTGDPCGIVHLLTELSVSMLYGPQPEYFWRKNTKVDDEIKNTYKKTYKQLELWRQKSPSQFKAIEIVLFNTFTLNYRRKIGEQINSASNIIETKEKKIISRRKNEFEKSKTKKEKIEEYAKDKEKK